jgi:hypothetical protein
MLSIQKEMKLKLILLGTMLAWFSAAGADNTESYVKDAFAKISKAAKSWNIRMQIVSGNEGVTHSEPDGTIVINIDEVKQIVSRIGYGYEQAAVRMIVAHEFAHEMQFINFHSTRMNMPKECEADVLSGALTVIAGFYDVFDHPTPGLITDYNYQSIWNRLDDKGNSLNECSSLMLQLGEDFTRENTHPNKDQRLIAFRIGAYYGTDWIIGKFHDMDTNPARAASVKKTYETMQNVIDYDPVKDDMMGWSLKIATYITHWYPPACRDIAVYHFFKKDSDIDGHKFTYWYKIKNIGEKTVILIFDDQAFRIRRTDPNNIVFWRNTSTAKHAIELKPGEIKQFSGKIPWFEDEQQSALLSMLGDPYSLYGCMEEGSESKINDTLSSAFNSIAHAPSLYNALDALLSEHGQYRDYTAGVGVCPKDDLHILYYPSLVNLPEAKETQVVRDVAAGTYAVEVDFYEGDDQQYARNEVFYIRDLLSRARPDFTYERQNGPAGIGYWNIFDRDKRPVGQILLRENPAGRVFGTVLTIYDKGWSN